MKHFCNMAWCQIGQVILHVVLLACLVNTEGNPNGSIRDVLDKMVGSNDKLQAAVKLLKNTRDSGEKFQGIEDGPAGPPGSSEIDQRKAISVKRTSDPNLNIRHYRCYDNENACVTWAAQGECNINPLYMHQYCQHACGTCCVNPHPDLQQCIIWAEQGECDINPDYMLTRCRAACNGCDLRYSRRGARTRKDTMSGAAPPEPSQKMSNKMSFPHHV